MLYKNDKWTNALTIIPFDEPGNTTEAPRILIQIGGKKDNTKTQIANQSLIGWMACTRKKEMKSKKTEGSGKLKQANVLY